MPKNTFNFRLSNIGNLILVKNESSLWPRMIGIFEVNIIKRVNVKGKINSIMLHSFFDSFDSFLDIIMLFKITFNRCRPFIRRMSFTNINWNYINFISKSTNPLRYSGNSSGSKGRSRIRSTYNNVRFIFYK